MEVLDRKVSSHYKMAYDAMYTSRREPIVLYYQYTPECYDEMIRHSHPPRFLVEKIKHAGRTLIRFTVNPRNFGKRYD
jgi:hypothetical protein